MEKNSCWNNKKGEPSIAVATQEVVENQMITIRKGRKEVKKREKKQNDNKDKKKEERRKAWPGRKDDTEEHREKSTAMKHNRLLGKKEGETEE